MNDEKRSGASGSHPQTGMSAAIGRLQNGIRSGNDPIETLREIARIQDMPAALGCSEDEYKAHLTHLRMGTRYSPLTGWQVLNICRHAGVHPADLVSATGGPEMACQPHIHEALRILAYSTGTGSSDYQNAKAALAHEEGRYQILSNSDPFIRELFLKNLPEAARRQEERHRMAQAKRFEKDIKNPDVQRAFVKAINEGLNGQDPKSHFDIYREELFLKADDYSEDVANRQAGDLDLQKEVREMIASAYGRREADEIYDALVDRMQGSRDLTDREIVMELRDVLPPGAPDELDICDKFYALCTRLEATKSLQAPVRRDVVQKLVLIEELDTRNHVHYLYCNHASEQGLLREHNLSLPSRKL